MKAERIWKGISVTAVCLQCCIQILILVVIWRLDMLPERYMILLTALFALLLLTSGCLLFVGGKKVSLPRRIVVTVLALVLGIGCGFACNVISDAYETMRHVTTPSIPSMVLNVYVLRDNQAQTLEETKDYTFGTTTMFDPEKTALAMEKLETQLGTDIDRAGFSSVPDMVDALYDRQIDAILLNSAYVVLLDENEVYAGFSEKTKVLGQISVEDPVPETTVPETSVPETIATTEPDTTETTVPKNHIAPFTVYISGLDTANSVHSTSRSDVNILVTVDPQNRQILMVNTPRDYYIPNPAGGGGLDKLTHCGIYGIDCSIKALTQLYGVSIDYYAKINFTGVKTLVDAVGGVTVWSDVAFKTFEDTYVQKGENYFDGREALAFARERHNLASGDNARGKNQMKVITALIKKLTSSKVLISSYAQILESLEGMLATNIPSELIMQMVKLQLEDMSTPWKIHAYAVTGENGREETYSMPGYQLSVMYCHDGMVKYGTQLIQMIKSGQLLSEEKMKYPG